MAVPQFPQGHFRLGFGPLQGKAEDLQGQLIGLELQSLPAVRRLPPPDDAAVIELHEHGFLVPVVTQVPILGINGQGILRIPEIIDEHPFQVAALGGDMIHKQRHAVEIGIKRLVLGCPYRPAA